MSYRRKKAASFCPTKTPFGKLVLFAIAEHANNDTGLASPSTARLARECCCSRRAVMRALTELRELGYIRYSDNIPAGITGKKRKYIVDLEQMTYAANAQVEGKPVQMPHRSEAKPVQMPHTPYAANAQVEGKPVQMPHTVTEGVTEDGNRGGASRKRSPARKSRVIIPDVPGLNAAAWEKLVRYRRKRGLANYATDKKAEALATLDAPTQMEAVDEAIENNWHGPWPKHFKPAETPKDRISRIQQDLDAIAARKTAPKPD